MKRQGYISKSLEGLEFGLVSKHDLIPYVDRSVETIFFGMYRWEDFEAFQRHTGGRILKRFNGIPVGGF